MIEKMKKYSFLIYYKTYNEFLESIQQAGVVHIIEKQKGIPDEATNLRQQMATADSLKNAIKLLQRRKPGAQKNTGTSLPDTLQADGMAVLQEYEQLKTKLEQLKVRQQSTQKEIEQMSVWGNFDLDILQKLKESGHEVTFYTCRASEFQPEWADKYNAIEVARVGAALYFITVAFTVAAEEEPDAEKVRLSTQSLAQLEATLQEAKSGVETADQQLDSMAVEHLSTLQETYRNACEQLDLSKVQLHVEKKADDKLILLEGWVPEIKESGLIQALETQDAYYIGRKPDKEDNTVPILLRNNKFTRLYEAIGELYDLPNYHELDLTPFFAPFYMMFFGLCLGDAGYGLLLLVAGLVMRNKVKPAIRPITTLVSVLGAATVVFGTISGTFFGIPLLDVSWPWLTSFKKFMLNSDQLFNLALIVGAVQIIFGMIIKAVGQVRRFGWKYSMEAWGWLILILGGGSIYLLYHKALLPPDTARYICYVVLGIAGVCIFILNTPGRNPLINVGSGLWSTYNMVTGLMGDLLSYIRLFALGICGGVMGFVFNDLAMQLSGDIPIVSHILMMIILLIGHSLNIFMSGLSAFVHPMRLTFVEFYKNSGFEGGGKKYKPLKPIVIDN